MIFSFFFFFFFARVPGGCRAVAHTFVALRVGQEKLARLISPESLLVDDLTFEIPDGDEHAIEGDGVEVLLRLKLIVDNRRHREKIVCVVRGGGRRRRVWGGSDGWVKMKEQAGL